MRYDKENGKLSVEISEPIKYANKGELCDLDTVVMNEPVKSSAINCIRLMQIVRKANMEISKFLEIKESTEKQASQAPLYKQEKIDYEEAASSASGIVEMVLTSADPEEFIEKGKELLTKRYDSTTKRHLLVVDDENETPVTGNLFDKLDISDQMFLIGVYIVFFDLSSTGSRKHMSSMP